MRSCESRGSGLSPRPCQKDAATAFLKCTAGHSVVRPSGVRVGVAPTPTEESHENPPEDQHDAAPGRRHPAIAWDAHRAPRRSRAYAAPADGAPAAMRVGRPARSSQWGGRATAVRADMVMRSRCGNESRFFRVFRGYFALQAQLRGAPSPLGPRSWWRRRPGCQGRWLPPPRFAR